MMCGLSLVSLPAFSQCDVEVSGILAYCNSYSGNVNNTIPGYFIGFRIQSQNGGTYNVVDLAGNVPMNLGKRINDINVNFEPSDTSRAPAVLGGGPDSLEFWYFGPFTNGDSFNIVLIDSLGICDTIEVASGVYTCEGKDPNACDVKVPLYFLDFSESAWETGGGGGVNENVDDVFLVMQRPRMATCCQTSNQRCFELIIHLDDDDIGILIDDVGNGSTGGSIYADSLNGFACGSSQMDTWPFYQDNGNNADDPLCLSGSAREWILLTCKHGNNVTGISVGTVGEINILPAYVYEDCTTQLEVLNVSSAMWASDDDPNLDNLGNFSTDSLSATFMYDHDTFGPITSCDGDTFTYFISGLPDNSCFPPDSVLHDTTFVVVYPNFSISIDSTCLGTNDSLLLEAILSVSGPGCDYQVLWSTGDTTLSITVPNANGEYSVDVIRGDLITRVDDCSPAHAEISVDTISVGCANVADVVSSCITELPEIMPGLVDVGGCGANPLIYAFDVSNNGSGCMLDSLIITRHYIVDFDGDTSVTVSDRDSCIQRFIYVDAEGPSLTCPPNITLGCNASTLPGDTGGFATADDNCSSALVSYTDIIDQGVCPLEMTITRIWEATDECGNTSTCNQIITIDDNADPVLSCPPDVTILCNEDTTPANTGTATATDLCDLNPIVTFTSTFTTGACPRIIIRTWTAIDECGNLTSCNQTITLTDNTPPAITCPANVTISCNDNTNPTNTGSASATDICDSTLAITFINSTVIVSCPQNRTINRTWSATDDCGNQSTCVQVITVVDDQPPAITCPPDITIQCTSSTLPSNTGSASALDNCDTSLEITNTDEILPGACAQQQSILRTWKATDDCGNSSTCVQSIIIIDSLAPVILCPPDLTLNCIESTLTGNTGVATATDNCDLSIILSFTDAIIPGDCPAEKVINRTWSTSDDCGNASSCLQIISVEDNTGPAIMCPANITIDYSDSTLPENTGYASATDNCDIAVAILYSDNLPLACAALNIITRTWIATDDCGNSSTCSQTILVDDHGAICGSVKDEFALPIPNVVVQLYTDGNANGIIDPGDNLLTSTLSDPATGNYCFMDLPPCSYIILQDQPSGYTNISDYDVTPDVDGNDILDGPDNDIPVVLSPGELDNDNNFVDIMCALSLPVIPPDTICEGSSVVFQTDTLNPGALSYLWNFGSGASPATGIGLGPHTVSYITTTDNQTGGAIISLTISKAGCPDVSGQVSMVDVNPEPVTTINGSISNLCYYTDRTFSPLAPAIPGATYYWTFGNNAVPQTATGYGPHTAYYTAAGIKTVKLVIYPNEAGAQCPDSSSISFNVVQCPSNITGSVKSISGQGISDVNLLLYNDDNLDGLPDSEVWVRSVFSTATGSYSMVQLVPGSYVIVQVQPEQWYTVSDGDTSPDGDPVPNIDTTDNLIPATLGPSQIDAHNIFTEGPVPGSITGAVFYDDDGDGFPDIPEGIEGVTISLYNDANQDGHADSGVVVDTAITSDSGYYLIDNVPVGHYVIVESQPAGFNSVSDGDISNDEDVVPNVNINNDTIPVSITNQEIDEDNYFIEDYECTLMAMNTNDAGPGSFRFMLDCAASGDTITFDSSLTNETITITSVKMEINKNIVVDASQAPGLTIASSVPGLFSIAPNKIVSFRDILIISGLSGNHGAAFYNFGELTLHNVTITKNPLLPGSEHIIRNSTSGVLIISGNTSINID